MAFCINTGRSTQHLLTCLHSTMDNQQRFTINSEFQVEQFDNEILLYSIADSKGIYLNETAFLIWEICGKGYSLEEIVSLLAKAYPQSKEAIQQDVMTTVESLVKDGVLVVADE